jgi:hypothetical protein
MSCNAIACLTPILEKLETITRLAPVLESDKELAHILSVLLDIAHDYVTQARSTLAAIAEEGRERA